MRAHQQMVPALGDARSVSPRQWAIIKQLAGWAPAATIGIVLCAGVILKRSWFSDDPPDLIYSPPLDRELRDKERESQRVQVRQCPLRS